MAPGWSLQGSRLLFTRETERERARERPWSALGTVERAKNGSLGWSLRGFAMRALGLTVFMLRNVCAAAAPPCFVLPAGRA